MSFDITSPSNDRIKWLVRLRERRHRDAEGVFVVEGERLYGRAIAAGLVPISTFVSKSGIDTTGETLRVAPEALDKASYRARSQGLIAVFPQVELSLGRLEVDGEPLILVVESLEKPGNLGAVARTAAAAGVSALIVVGDSVDAWNPNVLRASTGAVFSVPLAISEWDRAEPWLRDLGARVVAASPGARTTMWSSELTGPLAIIVGAEDAGLSQRAVAIADELVTIPQAESGVDSLNASVAAAVLLYEAVRQRRQMNRSVEVERE